MMISALLEHWAEERLRQASDAMGLGEDEGQALRAGIAQLEREEGPRAIPWDLKASEIEIFLLADMLRRRLSHSLSPHHLAALDSVRGKLARTPQYNHMVTNLRPSLCPSDLKFSGRVRFVDGVDNDFDARLLLSAGLSALRNAFRDTPVLLRMVELHIYGGRVQCCQKRDPRSLLCPRIDQCELSFAGGSLLFRYLQSVLEREGRWMRKVRDELPWRVQGWTPRMSELRAKVSEGAMALQCNMNQDLAKWADTICARYWRRQGV